MKAERKWQVIAGVSLLLFLLAALVAAWQFHQIRLLRSAGSSPRETRADPVPATTSATAPTSAEAGDQSDQAIAQQVALRIRQYHQDLTA